MFTPTTEVQLLANVPLIYNNENQVYFSGSGVRDSVMHNYVTHTFTKYTYQRTTRESIRIGINKDQILNCNYLRFKNSNYSNKWIYCYILNSEYINPNTTEIFYKVDAWQTFCFDISFKPCYIDREHQDEYIYQNLPVVNTIDENIDYGSDYQLVGRIGLNPYTIGSNNAYVCLLFCSKEPRNEDNSVFSRYINGVPENKIVYIVPFMKNNEANRSFNFIVGEENLSTLEEVLDVFATDESFVNTLVGISIVPYVPQINISDGRVSTSRYASIVARKYPYTTTSGTEETLTLCQYILSRGGIIEEIYNRPAYEPLAKFFSSEYLKTSKILMYPYTYCKLTDHCGNEIPLKLEYLESRKVDDNVVSNNTRYLKLGVVGSVAPEQKTAYIPKFYNEKYTLHLGSDFTGAYSDQEGYRIENALINSTVADLTIMTDQMGNYMQQNRNSMRTAIAINTINFGLNALSSAITLGSGVGMVSAGASGTTLVGNSSPQMTAFNGYNQSMSGVGGGLGSTMNYLSDIKMTQAKMKDIRNIPPSINQMGNNTNFSYGNGICGVYLEYYTLKDEYLETVTNYFKMYGYKKNKVDVPDISSRPVFNYCKTIGCIVSGTIPQEYAIEIQELFNRGVRMWHSFDNFGNYSLNNYPSSNPIPNLESSV